MSRILSDQVALAVDGVDKPERPFRVGAFDPRLPISSLGVRLLKISNAFSAHVNYTKPSSFAEPFTTRHCKP